jgi:CheY-like chemotaxis protein
MDNRVDQNPDRIPLKDGKPEVAPPSPKPEPEKPKKILVVEDERVTQTVLSMILKGAGYVVLTAKDAASALKVIRTEHPNLMTVDIDLSRGAAGEAWDGFRMVEWLWHYHRDDMVPFIVASGGNPETVKQRAVSAGAFGYLPKPLDKRKLLELVEEAIGPAPVSPPTDAAAAPPIKPESKLPPIPPALRPPSKSAG